MFHCHASCPKFRSDYSKSSYRTMHKLFVEQRITNELFARKSWKLIDPNLLSASKSLLLHDKLRKFNLLLFFQVAHRLAAKNRQSPTHNSPKMHLPPSSGVPGPRKLMASTASCRSKQQLPAISGSQDSSTGGRLSSNGALSEAEYMDLEEIPYEGIITETRMEENEPLSIDI